MIEYILYILIPLTILSPFILMTLKDEESAPKIQNFILGYHLFSFLVLLIIFLGTDDKSHLYQLSQSGNLFISSLLELKINSVIINFLIILHVVGFVQISLREEFQNNSREIFCYFLFYLLITLALCSTNVLTIVAIEEVLFLILYLNHKIKESPVFYDSRYFRIANLLMIMGGLVYLFDFEKVLVQSGNISAKDIASFGIISGMIIKLQLFPFNRNKFSSYTLEMNRGIIEQQFIVLLPTLVILTKLISESILTEFSILFLFYFSLLTALLTSISLIVQNNVKNISRLLIHVGVCLFLVHLCTGNVAEAVYSFMAHSLSYLGIVAFIGIISYKNETKNLKELDNVKINNNAGNIFLYILIGSSMALPFTPLAFSRYNIILSTSLYESSAMIVSLLLNGALLILSFSIFRLFWYSSHFFKPESKELKLSNIQILTLAALSILILIFIIIGIPDLFIESYSFSFRELLNSKVISFLDITIQRKNLTLMYTFAHPFIAILVIYFLYIKKNKEGKISDFKFKNVTLFNFAERNFSVIEYLTIGMDNITKTFEYIKTNILEVGMKKILSAIGGSLYQGSGFLNIIRPKGINSNLLYAATTMAIMLMFLFSKLL